MAVVRSEFQINEAEALLEALPRLSKLERQSPLWRARRELERGLARGLEIQTNEQATLRRMRRNAAERMAQRAEMTT